MSIDQRMRDVLDSIDALEREWKAGPTPPCRVGRNFHESHAKECLEAFFFRIGLIERLNGMFKQKALAMRYGMSKRAVEELCEFHTRVKQSNPYP